MTTTTEQRPKLATVDQIAQYLSLSRTTLYGLMDRGDLPFCKIEKARRIRWEDAEKLVDSSLIRR